MTKETWDTFRLTLMAYSGGMTTSMVSKLAIDKKSTNSNIPAWKEDFYCIYVLNRYLDLYLEWNLPTSEATNTNFFSISDMKVIEGKVNSLLNTNFSYDYILTT
jgi:hypothetical protein